MDERKGQQNEHTVVVTATGYPGWLYYYCASCPGSPNVSAKRFDRPEGYDEEGWSRAVDEFNAAHPHTEEIEQFR
jgi:hypothetical protein